MRWDFGTLTRLGPLRTMVAALLLAVAYLIGGSSTDVPVRAMIIEVIAIGALAFTILRWRGLRPPSMVLLALALVLGLPLLQLMPLPPQIWTTLPGRGVAADIAQFMQEERWSPWTLDSNATTKAFLSALVAVAMFLITFQSNEKERARLFLVLIGIALLSVLLSVLQAASPTGSFYPMAGSAPGTVVGFFANRNHQALFLVIAAIFSFALWVREDNRARFRGAPLALLGLPAVFAAAVFVTGSRGGMMMLAMAVVLAPLLLLRFRLNWKILAAAAVVIVIGLVALWQSPVVHHALQRFATAGDKGGRFQFWPEVWNSALSYFPAGAGAGTFQRSFEATEQLGAVGQFAITPAHVEVLEMLLEWGVAGVAVMLVLLAVFLGRAWAILRHGRRDGNDLLARAGLLAILMILFHSLFDYPARTFAHLAGLGLCAGLLFLRRQPQLRDLRDEADRVPEPQPAPERGLSPARLTLFIAMGIVSAWLLLLAGRTGLSESALERRQYALAWSICPGCSDVASRYAEEVLDAGDARRATRIAVRALRSSYQDASALRMIGLAQHKLGNEAAADTAFVLAARLGWRDATVQRWIFERALARGEPVAAAQAGDAMLRINSQREVVLAGFKRLITFNAGREALADRMAGKPDWAAGFLAELKPTTPEESSNLALFLNDLDERGALEANEDMQAFIAGMIAQGQLDNVLAMWKRLNPRSSGNPTRAIVDGDFSQLASGTGKRGPFGWMVRQGMGSTVRTAVRSDLSSDAVLSVETLASEREAVLRQLLALPPGAYELQFEARLGSGDPGDFRWAIGCELKGAPLGRGSALPDGHGEWAPGKLQFTVPGSNCTSQTLRLFAGPVTSEGAAALFDNLRIVPLQQLPPEPVRRSRRKQP